MKRIYIAGPMSGRPKFNFPYFYGVARDLRQHGYDVVSPAELDDIKFRQRVTADHVTGHEPDLLGAWGDSLARDVKLITNGGIEGIVLLPEWEQSRGARLEAFVGVLNQLKFALYAPHRVGLISPANASYIMNAIRRSLP